MGSEAPKKTRRRADDLVPLIFSVLPVQGVKTKTEIATEIGSKPDTVEEYLRIILYVQQQPRVEEMRIGRRRVGYRRAKARKVESP